MNAKIFRSGLLVAGGLLLMSASPTLARATAVAQDPGQAQAEPPQGTPDTSHRPNLNLSDDQKAQMKKLHEDAKSQIDAVKNDSSLSFAQKQSKIRQIHRDTHQQVQAMLTPEQKKTMREWRREHRGERRQQQPQQQPPAN